MDKHKENRITLEKTDMLKFDKGVIRMAEKDSDLLNTVYKEIADYLGIDDIKSYNRTFKGTARS